MPDSKFFDDIAAKLSALFAASPAKDVEKNVRALLSGAFARLDLVTREEFDIQRELLARARERLIQLESRIAELEAKAGGKPRA
jgi:BMFP domain-containing protein YqiC